MWYITNFIFLSLFKYNILTHKLLSVLDLKILEKRLHITRSKRQKDNISWWISFTFALFTKVIKILTPIIIDRGWFVLNIWKSGKRYVVFVSSSSFGLCILLLRTFLYTGKHVCLTFKDLYFSFFLWILVRCLSHIFKQKHAKVI